MTEPSAATAPEPSARIDDIDPPWRARPAIMAGLCALAGIFFYNLIDSDGAEAVAAFVAVATVAFVLTAEERRLHWAMLFALVWGGVIALIVENNRGYSVNGSPFEWPFWSGLLAVCVAAPLFQGWRDGAESWRDWRLDKLSYARLHLHGWTDAVIGAAAGLFVGISFALAFLIAGLFDLIGIRAIGELLREGWFAWGLAGAAFGGAVGLLRERDRLVGNLQRLVMVVLSVLAPVLASALALFLLSLIGTGFAQLWASGFSTAGLMLGASAFAVLLANAVIGNGVEDRVGNPVLRWAAPVLAAIVLPLAVIALYAMLMRIGQYGWTPERLWGMVAVVIALAYGAAGLWSVVRGRANFDDVLRPLQQKLAIGLMLLATFLALPIMDFGAISTRDQLARLESGAVKPAKFDWAAMAFDFGPEGRDALQKLARSKDVDIADPAKVALASKDRWDLGYDTEQAPQVLRPIEKSVRLAPGEAPLTPDIYERLKDNGLCRRTCIVRREGGDWLAVVGRFRDDSNIELQWLQYDAKSKRWENRYQPPVVVRDAEKMSQINLDEATVTTREVVLEQLIVDGQPVGDPYVRR
jgi:Domain of unknown function (DUF4153)